MNKESRLKRALRQRCKIKQLKANRLTVYRTAKHIYAQVLNNDGTATVASASTVEPKIKSGLKKGSGNVKAATAIGNEIAKRALKAGISEVAFDRSGFKYHGRVKALAEAARESGLKF